jgi:predicted nucleic acid-binding protein
LLETFLSLAFDIVLPDLVLAEFDLAGNSVLVPPQVELVEFDADRISRILVLQSSYGGLSIPDSAALFLARERQAVLLTGDRALRNAAIREQVSVHGVLWILDELLEKALIDTARACLALDVILTEGARLPDYDCDLRFSQWGCVRGSE